MIESDNVHALLLFAHGSSDSGWAEPFLKLRAIIRKREPRYIVELAFLERMNPSFDEAVDALQERRIRQITVAPIFLALGGHMRNDLPKLITDAEARTGVDSGDDNGVLLGHAQDFDVLAPLLVMLADLLHRRARLELLREEHVDERLEVVALVYDYKKGALEWD